MAPTKPASERLENRMPRSVELLPQSPNTFPFLRLPHDLRLIVYKQVFATKTNLKVMRRCCRAAANRRGSSEHECIWGRLVGCSKTPINIKFLLACKTIYVEALPILYGMVKFSINSQVVNEFATTKLNYLGLRFLTELRVTIDQSRKSPSWVTPVAFSRHSSWGKIMRLCANIQTVNLNTIIGRDRPMYAWNDDKTEYMTFTELIFRIAFCIATADLENPSFVVLVKRAASQPKWWKSRAEELSDGARHGSFTFAKKGTLELMGRLDETAVDFVQRYSKDGWTFRKTDFRPTARFYAWNGYHHDGYHHGGFHQSGYYQGGFLDCCLRDSYLRDDYLRDGYLIDDDLRDDDLRDDESASDQIIWKLEWVKPTVTEESAVEEEPERSVGTKRKHSEVGS